MLLLGMSARLPLRLVSTATGHRGNLICNRKQKPLETRADTWQHRPRQTQNAMTDKNYFQHNSLLLTITLCKNASENIYSIARNTNYVAAE
jgi:hypothetical protein